MIVRMRKVIASLLLKPIFSFLLFLFACFFSFNLRIVLHITAAHKGHAAANKFKLLEIT